MRSNQVSRRNFLKGTAAGIGALSLGDRWALAEALATGKGPKTAADIRGNGVAPGIVKLNNNENPLGASPRAIKAIVEHLFETNRYYFSDREDELNRKIAGLHGLSTEHISSSSYSSFGSYSSSSSHTRSRQSPILASPGSALLLHTIGVRAVGDGTGEVIEAEPAYGSVKRPVEDFKERGAKTNVIRVRLKEDYTHDLEAMYRAITPRTTCVVITNPNNPTGTIVSHAALTDFVDSVPEKVTVFIDEAYIHFVSEPGYQDATDLALSRKNVIVTRTFSKIYGLAGMRVGYAVADPEIIEELKLYGEIKGCLSTSSSAAVMAALEDSDFVRRTQQAVADGKEYLYGELTKMGLSYTPSHSNFVMVDLRRDKNPVGRALQARNILISSRPYEDYMPTFVRVSIGTHDEMEVFLSTLRAVLTEMG